MTHAVDWQLSLRTSLYALGVMCEYDPDSPEYSETVRRFSPDDAADSTSGETNPGADAITERILQQLRTAIDDGEMRQLEHLDDTDLQVIAILYTGFLRDHPGRGALDLARIVSPGGPENLSELCRLARLTQSGLLFTEMRKKNHTSASLDMLRFSQSRLRLSRSLLRQLLPQPEWNRKSLQPDIHDHQSLLHTLLDFADGLKHLIPAESAELPLHPQANGYPRRRRLIERVVNAWKRIETGMEQLAAFTPLSQPFTDPALTQTEKIMWVWALGRTIIGESADFDDLRVLLSHDRIEYLDHRALLLPDAPLFDRGYLEVFVPDQPMFREESVRVPEARLQALLHPDSVNSSHALTVIHTDRYRLELPRADWDQLVLDADLQEQLDSIMQGQSDVVRERLHKWGIEMRNGTLAGGTCILLSGDSGTGKTFAAHALAQKLGRRIMTTDMSQLLSKWMGESEQHVTELFQTFHRAVQHESAAPVLLLNECDQFFSRRETGNYSSMGDRSHHILQNLFLEHLENAIGIIIATTNLVESLDPAFSRRFQHKLVFRQPDAKARLRLWQNQLPKTLPLDRDVDLPWLARRYPFSGGQIALVCRNAIQAAAQQSDTLGMHHLKAAASQEEAGAFTAGTRKIHVGFHKSPDDVMFCD